MNISASVHTPSFLSSLSFMTSAQSPTLRNVRIRSVRDALQVFYAVATKRLPLITRRLDAEERRAIVSGNVYVWEERGANTEPTGLGMERWTDGMGWGPSRVRDEFLFYHQKESNFSDELLNPVTPWAQMMRKREQPGAQMSGYSSMQPERLVKQTYSVHVSLPGESLRGVERKWHLTAYFSQQRLDELDIIDRIPGVGDVPVPDGLFRSARAGKLRRDHRSSSKKSKQPPDLAIGPESYRLNHGQASSPSSRRRSSLSSDHLMSPSSLTANRSRHSSPSSDAASPESISPTRQPAKLVPLEYLQNVSGTRRDPVDEQFLRRFSSQAIGRPLISSRLPGRSSA
ncbi:putative gti1/Pac2 family protein [Lyophyllum shimeji]|uniref:Gti1/Pac2 family protein n=1 Tax=Lyophyllum shimeji TaxID=47721 RepID=A0A9P3PP24_LYOSH|nr:putative gti1/Pac2 family protein [Lyophyllum shimeji]